MTQIRKMYLVARGLDRKLQVLHISGHLISVCIYEWHGAWKRRNAQGLVTAGEKWGKGGRKPGCDLALRGGAVPWAASER